MSQPATGHAARCRGLAASALALVLAACAGGCESARCAFLPASNDAIRWEYTAGAMPDGISAYLVDVGPDGDLYLAGVEPQNGMDARSWHVAFHSRDGGQWGVALGEETLVGAKRGALHALDGGGAVVATPAGRLFGLSADGERVWSETRYAGRDCISAANESGLAIRCESVRGQTDLARYDAQGVELWSREADGTYPVLHRNGEVSLVTELRGSVRVKHIDAMGETAWAHSFPIEPCTACAIRSVQPLGDCGLLVLAWEAFEDGVPGTYLVRIDCSGQQIHGGRWSGKHIEYEAEQLATGHMLLAGMSCSNKQRESDAVLLELDRRGEQVAERWFGREPREGAVAIRESREMGLAIAAVRDEGYWVFEIPTD